MKLTVLKSSFSIVRFLPAWIPNEWGSSTKALPDILDDLSSR